MIEFHVLDFKIQITVAAVKIRQRVLVVVKLVLLEHAAAVSHDHIQRCLVLSCLRSSFCENAAAPMNSTCVILTFGLSVI